MEWMVYNRKKKKGKCYEKDKKTEDMGNTVL